MCVCVCVVTWLKVGGVGGPPGGGGGGGGMGILLLLQHTPDDPETHTNDTQAAGFSRRQRPLSLLPLFPSDMFTRHPEERGKRRKEGRDT